MGALREKVARMMAYQYPWDFSDDDIAEILEDKTRGELLNMVAELLTLKEEEN